MVASTFLVVGPTMATTLTDVGGTPHGNAVSAQLAVEDGPVDTFFASDCGAPSGVTQVVAGVLVSSPPYEFTTPSPMNVATPIIFYFDVAPPRAARSLSLSSPGLSNRRWFPSPRRGSRRSWASLASLR